MTQFKKGTIPWNKGISNPLLSIRNKGNKYGIGHKVSEEQKNRARKFVKNNPKFLYWMGGVKRGPMSETQKKKLSEAKRGIPRPNQAGEKNPLWKGKDVSYGGLHNWVRRKRGKPSQCAYCGSTDRKPIEYHWANISGAYKRDLSDWIRLCVKCHKNYDMGNITLNI